MARGLLALLLGSLVPAAHAASLPDADTAQREMRAFVEVHRGAPGVVVGLLHADGRRDVLAYGTSGREQRPTLDGATRFEIGSITKTFTGALLADMLLKGEVRTDQTVGELAPDGVDFANGVGAITLEQLATHTSGLPRVAIDPWSLTRIASTDPYAGSTVEDVFESAAWVPRQLVAPTQTLAYSNLGYALLGQLLARRGGLSYEPLLRQRVLEPLGLGSVLTRHPDESPPELARGHDRGGRPAPYWHAEAYAPAGGLIASADELLEYLALNLQGTHPMLAEAQRARTSFSTKRAIGLGWLHGHVGGESVIWHNGGTGGFRSFAGFLPESRIGLVVLANGPGDTDALARRLLDPGEPPPAPHAATAVDYAITWTLLAMAPILLLGTLGATWRTRREHVRASVVVMPAAAGELPPDQAPPKPPRADKLDVLRRPLAPLIALIAAERLGHWLDVSFAWWWVALSLSIALYALLVWLGRELPWRRSGAWKLAGRALLVALEVAVLLLLVT